MPGGGFFKDDRVAIAVNRRRWGMNVNSFFRKSGSAALKFPIREIAGF
jgi:hypothetical protein